MTRHDDEREAIEGSDRSRAAAAANAQRVLQVKYVLRNVLYLKSDVLFLNAHAV